MQLHILPHLKPVRVINRTYDLPPGQTALNVKALNTESQRIQFYLTHLTYYTLVHHSSTTSGEIETAGQAIATTLTLFWQQQQSTTQDSRFLYRGHRWW